MSQMMMAVSATSQSTLRSITLILPLPAGSSRRSRRLSRSLPATLGRLGTGSFLSAVAGRKFRPKTNAATKPVRITRNMTFPLRRSPSFQESPKLFHLLGKGGILGQVGVFFRVGVVVVQFHALLATVPFGTAPALGPYGFTLHFLVVGHGVGGFVPRGVRLLQQRRQALPFQPGRPWQGAQFGQGGVDVDQLHDPGAGLPFP